MLIFINICFSIKYFCFIYSHKIEQLQIQYYFLIFILAITMHFYNVFLEKCACTKIINLYINFFKAF